jgi:transcriptional regulator with XRE-family HTH domain
LKHRELAEKAGISSGLISKLETEKQGFGPAVLRRLAEALEVDELWLLTGEAPGVQDEGDLLPRWRNLPERARYHLDGLVELLQPKAEQAHEADILPIRPPPPTDADLVGLPETRLELDECRELPFFGSVAAFEQWSPEYEGQVEPEGVELVPAGPWGPDPMVCRFGRKG